MRISPGGPLPICGEEVHIEERFPRLTEVRRSTKPVIEEGFVASFDSVKGWGFVGDSQGERLFLHKVDIEGGGIPVIGVRVRFFRGYSRGRARACWVQLVGGSHG